jgi:zinc D-Ala-D-Ala dipeptidase
MRLVEIAPAEFDVTVALAYATADNLTGAVIYKTPLCYLAEPAAEKLAKASRLARNLGLRLKIFDAYRPAEAQWKLWNALPDPEFIADPRRGSPHTRGVAVDLTLIGETGEELDMGTGFDAITPLSHHANTEIPVVAQRNRFILMGLMMAAGWDNYMNEWWHYQLFNARDYPLIEQAVLPRAMM